MRIKKCLWFVHLVLCTGSMPYAFSQGWHAVIEVNLGEALRSIDNATLTYSGGTAFGSSNTSILTLDLRGTTTPSGPLYIYASGRSVRNYDQVMHVSATYTGSITADCDVHYFETYGMQNQYISGTITVYPRLEISKTMQDCDQIVFTTDVCAPGYTWEVSENFSGPFTIIPERITSQLSVTADDLYGLGLSRFGQKYFRVTGLAGTTSLIEVAGIHYPGPTASIAATSPKCYHGAEGMIEIDIASSYPSVIDDFVVTLFNPEMQTTQHILDNTSVLSVPMLAAGSYSVKIENNSNKEIYGSCWVEYAVTLVDPPEVTIPSFEISDYNGYAIKCKDGSDGRLKANPSGGTGVYSAYTWIPDISSTDTGVNLSEGTYQVRVKDSNDCWSNGYSQLLTAPDKLMASLESTGGKGGFDVSCQDKHDGVITATVSGGVPGYLYTWSNGSTTRTLTGMGVGTYSLTVQDANGCTRNGSSRLMAPPPIDFAIAEIAEVRCPGGHSGVLEVQSAFNTIGQVYYSWSSGESGKEITDKPAGSYSVTVSDDQGCRTTKAKTLIEPLPYSVELMATSDYNGSDIRCHGENNGILTTTVKDENGNITNGGYYTWYKNGNALVSGTSRSGLDQLSAGTYKVEIEYRDICKAEKTFMLNEPDPLNISLVESIEPACNGDCNGKLKVMAEGGIGNHRYQWTNFAGSEVGNLCAGNYAVKVTDENGCLSERSFNLNQSRPLSVRLLSARPPACHDGCDGSLEIETSGGTGPLRYEWLHGENGAGINQLCAGSYTAIITDINRCTTTETFTLENPPAPSLDLGGSLILCAGQTHILDAGPGWKSYSWGSNTGWTGASQQATIQEAGMYWLEAVSTQGCMAEDTFLLETSLDLLTANFLLTTEALAGDTVVMIDISWPLPDQATWSFPSEMKRVLDVGDIVHGQFENTGSYQVSLTAALGDCRDEITKTITILDRGEDTAAGRLGYEPFVKEFNLYPNPNEGMFDVVLSFIKETPVVLSVWNILTAKKIGQVQDSGSMTYLKHFDLRPLSTGAYSLRLDYAEGTKYIRFIVR